MVSQAFYSTRAPTLSLVRPVEIRVSYFHLFLSMQALFRPEYVHIVSRPSSDRLQCIPGLCQMCLEKLFVLPFILIWETPVAAETKFALGQRERLWWQFGTLPRVHTSNPCESCLALANQLYPTVF